MGLFSWLKKKSTPLLIATTLASSAVAYEQHLQLVRSQIGAVKVEKEFSKPEREKLSKRKEELMGTIKNLDKICKLIKDRILTLQSEYGKKMALAENNKTRKKIIEQTLAEVKFVEEKISQSLVEAEIFATVADSKYIDFDELIRNNISSIQIKKDLRMMWGICTQLELSLKKDLKEVNGKNK